MSAYRRINFQFQFELLSRILRRKKNGAGLRTFDGDYFASHGLITSILQCFIKILLLLLLLLVFVCLFVGVVVLLWVCLWLFVFWYW